MGHEIDMDGKVLAVPEILARIRGEFSCVVVDEVAGSNRAIETAAWIERSPPQLFLGHHDAAMAQAKSLRTLKPGDALRVDFGDVPGSLVTCFLCPGESLRFGYRGESDEEAQLPLIERLARALDAKIVAF